MSLLLRPVQRLYEAFNIAKVRNTGREFMTNDQREITEPEQQKWFEQVYLPAHRNDDMFGICGYKDGVAVAYGLIKRDATGCWVTGVIRPEYQGKGYGREVFEFLCSWALLRAPSVYLEVLASNTRAIELYRKLGFQAISSTPRIMIMEKKR
jgi:ribosomal protein S18 acetylase RimI-like enzyme